MEASVGVCDLVRAKTTGKPKVKHLSFSSIDINNKRRSRAVTSQCRTERPGAREYLCPVFGVRRGEVLFNQQKAERTGESTKTALRGLPHWAPHPPPSILRVTAPGPKSGCRPCLPRAPN